MQNVWREFGPGRPGRANPDQASQTVGQLLCADPGRDLIKARDEEQIAILKVQGKYHPDQSLRMIVRPSAAERIDK